ncbi:LamG-like jellyroll fold domain-containing protein [Saccharicrinis sp. FJH54]|uniref:LamG-like jellyroll fold domain-containing protein n=1 Tax=Saccharicrinis sp. FJH54 TaxID=3344665 RepID=UPI0035D4EA17
MKSIFFSISVLLLFYVFPGSDFCFAANYVTWNLDNLTSSGDFTFTTEGDPEIIPVNDDFAMLFDGTEDRIVVESNPLIGMDEFTLEVIFRIDKGGISEQKFLHLQANPDIRILFEIEFVNDSMWYLENYIQSGSGESENVHLINPEKLHPAGRWYHAALVYSNKTFKQFINYQLENSGMLHWVTPEDGAVSVGARMNQVNYMTGAVREIRFADEALDSSHFLRYGQMLEESETYVFDNLISLNGYGLQVFGDPEIVDTEIGKGAEFDGEDDGIYVLHNPIGNSQQFTIETIVKPYDVYPENADPRYFHIEDANNSNRRITMELRLNENHEWYFDGFLRADNNSIGLMEPALTHPLDGWQHMAIIYSNGHFETYVNYKKELEDDWEHVLLPFSDATKMSVGMRMNKVNYFNGIIQRIRITHAILDTGEFMKINKKEEATPVDQVSMPSQNLEFKIYPNPVRKDSEMEVYQTLEGVVKLELYNLAGDKVDELFNGYMRAGLSCASIDFQKYESGLYLLKLINNSYQSIQKISVL